MCRYFFDVIGEYDSEFDYIGREFAAPENGIEFAKLLAIDLEIMREGARVGSTVVMRDPLGRSYFAARVEAPEQVAA